MSKSISSISIEETLDFLIYLEHELRDYADGPAYDDEAYAAFRFMDSLADEIMAFLNVSKGGKSHDGTD